jgi:hypothetical protein
LFRFPQLICEPDLTLALAIFDVCLPSQYDDMTHILLSLFDSRRMVVKFLRAVIEKEVNETGKKVPQSRFSLPPI